MTWGDYDDQQKLTALQLDAVLHARPDPLKQIRDDEFWDGVRIGVVVTAGVAIFIGLVIWQSAKGL